MAVNKNTQNVYGLDGVVNLVGDPIISRRSPTTKDKAPLGKIWIDKTTYSSWMCCGVVANSAHWSPSAALVAPVVIAGNCAITGTTTMTGLVTMTAGVTGVLQTDANIVAATTIVAGTSIAAGTSVAATTSIIAGTTITSTLGNVTATNGEFVSTVATKGFRLGAAGPKLTAGAGAPAAVLPQGSLYIRTDGASEDECLYVATDGAGTWHALQGV